MNKNIQGPQTDTDHVYINQTVWGLTRELIELRKEGLSSLSTSETYI